MGNVISSFFSSLIDSISKLFGSPLDFLSGKSCSTVCSSQWDLICYIENFCVANLFKMGMVLILCYIILLFIYLSYKLGICHCIGHSICKMIWGSIKCWFSAWEYCCTFLCVELMSVRRKRRRRYRREMEDGFYTSDIEYNDRSFSYHTPRHIEQSSRSWRSSRRRRNYKGIRLRRSLRPRSVGIRAGSNRDSVYGCKRNLGLHRNHASKDHELKMRRTSKFVQKRYKL